MTRRQISSTKKQLSVSTYITIAAVGFLVSLFCTYYYLHFIQGSVSENVSQKIFYLILILFGIAASALVFGVMNSYGVLSGHRFDTKFQFTGPVVGVILVVMGGFFLPKTPKKESIAIRVVDRNKIPVTNGKVTIYFPRYTREEMINAKGTAVFSDINEEDITSKIKVDVISDGYARLTFDTSLTGFAPLQLSLSHSREIQISGQVVTAGDSPIKDVEVIAEGTRFYGKTINNGGYSIKLYDFAVGEEIILTTSHKDYYDKVKRIKITGQQMSNIDFVLQPLLPN